MEKSTQQLSISPKYTGYSMPLETFDNPTWWQLKGLSYTATGYGNKIPTSYMVKHHNRMKRVYCRIYSNIGTLYIMFKGKNVILVDY